MAYAPPGLIGKGNLKGARKPRELVKEGFPGFFQNYLAALAAGDPAQNQHLADVIEERIPSQGIGEVDPYGLKYFPRKS